MADAPDGPSPTRTQRRVTALGRGAVALAGAVAIASATLTQIRVSAEWGVVAPAPPFPGRYLVAAAGALALAAAALAWRPRGRGALALAGALTAIAALTQVHEILTVTDRARDIADMQGLGIMVPHTTWAAGAWLTLSAALIAVAALVALALTPIEPPTLPASTATRVVVTAATVLVVAALLFSGFRAGRVAASGIGGSIDFVFWINLTLGVALIAVAVSAWSTTPHPATMLAAALTLGWYVARPFAYHDYGNISLRLGFWCAAAAVFAYLVVPLLARRRASW